LHFTKAESKFVYHKKLSLIVQFELPPDNRKKKETKPISKKKEQSKKSDDAEEKVVDKMETEENDKSNRDSPDLIEDD
jgi:hypothetical protein